MENKISAKTPDTIQSTPAYGSKPKVCMFVYNSFRPDVRPLKEAKSLMAIGYDVEVFALLDLNTIPYQEFDGVKVRRIKRNPLPLRLIQGIKTIGSLNIDAEESGSTSRVRSLLKYLRVSLRVFRWVFTNLFITAIYFLIIVGGIEALERNDFRELLVRYKLPIYCVAFILIAGRKPLTIYFKKYRSVYTGFKKRLNLKLRAKRFKAKVKRKLQILLTDLVKRLFRPIYGYFAYFDFYKRCYNQILSSPADIYHAHDLNTLAVGWWCKKRLGGKLVYDSHELFTETSLLSKSGKTIWTWAEKLLIKKCDHVITVCDSIAEELKGRYDIFLPTVLMNCPERNGCLLEQKDLIREAAGIDKETPVVLYQGGFSDNRGLRKLLLAGSYLERGKLVMMGWGRIEDELKTFVRENDLDDRVRFIPPAPQKELLYWSASADVGVIPYRAVGLNNYYSCPNKLFEYINAGLPVAGSAFPEISKIINGWDLGITFEPESPESIAESINSLLSDENELSSMRMNARKAAEVLNWKYESEKLLELYSDLKD